MTESEAIATFQSYLEKQAAVSKQEFERFASFIHVLQIPKGRILVDPNKERSQVYFVAKGLLRLFATDSEGKEHMLSFAAENWWIGDRNNPSLDKPAELFIDAYEDSVILELGTRFFEGASEQSPAFRSFNERLMLRHMNKLYQRVYSLIGTNAKQRYEEFLRTYPNLAQRLPQTLIASYLGMTPESLSRIRKEMAQLKN
ncbi:MAG: Crp/Fnr family transcriptional regulator [Bacteroidia bacterium]